jgi:catechol 2,3-dioxygenase-like lactoylglutathione lyase family enzyme
MSGAGVSGDSPTKTPQPGTIDMKLEVVTLPVSDVDRAKAFYQSLGWRLDADLTISDDIRAVQFTPTHSDCSVTIAKGLTNTEPGSVQRELVVSDIEAAREDLIGRGVEVGEPYHRGAEGLAPGLDPERRSYLSYASFNDPDGNGWLLQEVNERPPGRLWGD